MIVQYVRVCVLSLERRFSSGLAVSGADGV